MDHGALDGDRRLQRVSAGTADARRAVLVHEHGGPGLQHGLVGWWRVPSRKPWLVTRVSARRTTGVSPRRKSGISAWEMPAARAKARALAWSRGEEVDLLLHVAAGRPTACRRTGRASRRRRCAASAPWRGRSASSTARAVGRGRGGGRDGEGVYGSGPGRRDRLEEDLLRVRCRAAVAAASGDQQREGQRDGQRGDRGVPTTNVRPGPTTNGCTHEDLPPLHPDVVPQVLPDSRTPPRLERVQVSPLVSTARN